jgi:hypothetical protein
MRLSPIEWSIDLSDTTALGTEYHVKIRKFYFLDSRASTTIAPVPRTSTMPSVEGTKDGANRLYLLDYGAGNVQSLANTLTKLGYEFRWIRDPDDFQHADVRALVLSLFLHLQMS